MRASNAIKLWAMMLLQYAIWGSWGVTLGNYIIAKRGEGGLEFSSGTQGFVMALLPLASIFVTPLFGNLADRVVNSERLLAGLHFISAVALYLLGKTYDLVPFTALVAIHCMAYAPTLSLTNSIVFENVGDSTKGFGPIRVAGTIGWMAAGWILAAMRTEGVTPPPGDFFILGAIASLALAILALFLPPSPPKKQGTHPFAFLDALGLLKNRNFLIFMVCALVVGTELEFYYIHTYSFLTADGARNGIGLSNVDAPRAMSYGQMAEIVVMLALPFIIARFGLRKTIVIGIIAWPIRYFIFAFASRSELLRQLVVPSITLHGFCYVCFFVAGFIYVDNVAPTQIRASAQALIAMVVLGIGRAVGSFIASAVQGAYTVKSGNPSVPDTVDWYRVFLVPAVLTLIAAIAFPLLFKGGDERSVDVNAIPTHG